MPNIPNRKFYGIASSFYDDGFNVCTVCKDGKSKPKKLADHSFNVRKLSNFTETHAALQRFLNIFLEVACMQLDENRKGLKSKAPMPVVLGWPYFDKEVPVERFKELHTVNTPGKSVLPRQENPPNVINNMAFWMLQCLGAMNQEYDLSEEDAIKVHFDAPEYTGRPDIDEACNYSKEWMEKVCFLAKQGVTECYQALKKLALDKVDFDLLPEKEKYGADSGRLVFYTFQEEITKYFARFPEIVEAMEKRAMEILGSEYFTFKFPESEKKDHFFDFVAKPLEIIAGDYYRSADKR